MYLAQSGSNTPDRGGEIIITEEDKKRARSSAGLFCCLARTRMRSHEATIFRAVRIMGESPVRHIIFAGPCVNFRPTCFEVSQGKSICINLFSRYRLLLVEDAAFSFAAVFCFLLHREKNPLRGFPSFSSAFSTARPTPVRSRHTFSFASRLRRKPRPRPAPPPKTSAPTTRQAPNTTSGFFSSASGVQEHPDAPDEADAGKFGMEERQTGRPVKRNGGPGNRPSGISMACVNSKRFFEKSLKINLEKVREHGLTRYASPFSQKV